MSVVLFRYFRCFGLFVPLLFFIRRSQGSTLGFRPFPTRRRFASRKSIRSEFFLSTSFFSFFFPLLTAAFCDIAIGHGHGKGLGSRSNFALPRVIQSINVRKEHQWLTDCATLGSGTFYLGPKLLPRPWPIAISQDAAERSDRKRRWKMLIFNVMREDFCRREICTGARIIEA